MKPLTLAFFGTVVLLATSGCGGQQRPLTKGNAWQELRIHGAALPARRTSGAPWHMSGVDESGTLLGGLIGLAVGYPDIGLALGSALNSEAEPQAPAPYVVIKVAGDSYGISPVGRTLSPRWTQPIAIRTARYAHTQKALIQVLDAVDGGSVLGQKELTIGELLAPGARTLTDIGEVKSLDLEVIPRSERPSVTLATYVDSTLELAELVEGRDPRWTAIPVWNGDRITIVAQGSVCPSEPSPCFGPDGAEAGRWTNYNYKGFEAARHAALVGVLPGDAFVVGSGTSLIADQSGYLLLFVNDTDEGNNDGGFDVQVTVEPTR